ncbi:MAG TPA: hypothetical protein VFE98_05380 [Candidatus Bathyarchaeia archaeon]|nr:hypothetical protein [Candidatus Bathyarchaeia archaeon]
MSGTEPLTTVKGPFLLILYEEKGKSQSGGEVMNDPRIEKLERRVHDLEDKIRELEGRVAAVEGDYT